ncbi:TnsA endonuclease N-terminal domain-containing protein [Thauera humireducens]|uniref:TnsA endonuclease N-terminal domain-containing protein n=1 Tax=Thauera humireducens TaxID=1134435 RepID=UPI00311E29E7
MPRRKAPSFKSGAIVRCESSQEEEAVARFEACPSVTKITAQPVRITYMHEGKQRRTTPDFKLTLDDGLDVYVEIKHTNQALTMAAVLEARAVGSAAQGLDLRHHRPLDSRRAPAGEHPNSPKMAGCRACKP